MSKFIPLSVPNFNGNEEKYVLEAVRTEWVSTGGKYINDFEEALASYLNVSEAVACQSGTAGLHLSLIASEVEEGSMVIVPTLTFIAAVNPVSYVKAEAVFMDCDDTLCMDPIKLKRFIDEECNFIHNELIHNNSQKCVKALIFVHVFGNIGEIEEIARICETYNISLIEDATEALGSYVNSDDKKYAGSFGDYGVFSFNGNKIITTGGGGAVVSKHLNKLSHIKYLSTQAKDDTHSYIHHDIGYNYRMTNLQAALGLAQLEQLEIFIETKNMNYDYYKERIDSINGLSLIAFREDIRSNKWFYSLLINTEIYGMKREHLMMKLEKNNIQTRPIWGLIHNQRPYQSYIAYHIEKAILYHRDILNLPCSSNLSKSDIDMVIDSLIK